MPLVTSKHMLYAAQKGGYAVPAFNAENMEMFQAIVQAAESCGSPVMIQTTGTTAAYTGLETAAAMASSLAVTATVPVAMHLDHCESFATVMQAIAAGYTSLMYDGSKRSFADNMATTAAVMCVTAPMGLTTEAELGAIGGKEDATEADNAYADPDQVEEFVNQTKVDILAVAIGTVHGVYKGEPKLDFKLLQTIRQRVDIPLVLHGASGLPEHMVREAISLGMCKVNFATELRMAFTEAVRTVLLDEKIYDPKAYGKKGREAVVALCCEKIRMCGSAGRI
ncbi:MAG: class II fructose-bisphosphate aldolase [Planctomycetes bacterium]|nr:class II fructose-bisphosphate aldolase [Planctomycetota bacterium]